MDIATWQKATRLYTEYQRRGEKLGRIKLSELLAVPERKAREILFALENKSVISSDVDLFSTSGTELVMADLHIPYQDDTALSAMFSYIEDQHITPSTVCILGDLLDFYEISTFNKDPRRKNVAGEIKDGKDFLIKLRNKWPDARIILAEGNHEQRLQRYIFRQASELTDLLDSLLEDKLGLKDINAEYLVAPFHIGKLWHLHGHEKTGGSYNVEYPSNVIWNYMYRHFICGHFHRRQQKMFKAVDGTTYWTAVVGYLAGELDWAPLNKWDSGFGIIEYDDSGAFRAEVKTIYNGRVY